MAVTVTSQAQAATGHRPAAVVKVSLVSIESPVMREGSVSQEWRGQSGYQSSSPSPEGGAWERGGTVVLKPRYTQLYIGQRAGIRLKSNLNCM